jgi:hypothetical protein
VALAVLQSNKSDLQSLMALWNQTGQNQNQQTQTKIHLQGQSDNQQAKNKPR